MVDVAVSGFLYSFATHIDCDSLSSDLFFLDYWLKGVLGDGGLSSLLIVILIPLYLYLLRPFFHDYIPGMLKRIGLGMILILLSALCTLSMDTFGHLQTSNSTSCFLNNDLRGNPYCTLDNDANLNISSYFLVIQGSLNAIGYMLFYVGVYEFICAQSPHAMKGLIVGTFFAIKGVFQLLGVVVLFVPFTQWNLPLRFPSCGFVYYLINVAVGFAGIVSYTWVARKYRYRQRDEPDNIYRYAEDYYANAQDEPNYDYDDYDDLNVQTIHQ